MRTNIERFKRYSEIQGFAPDVYLELLEEFEKTPQILLLRGDDFHNADHLAQWGFLQQIRKPLIDKDGQFRGMGIGFCHPDCNLKHVESSNELF